MKRWLYAHVLRMRNRHLFALDIIMLSLTPALSLLLRGEQLSDVSLFVLPLAVYTGLSMIVKVSTFAFSKFYSHYWRYASVDEAGSLGIGAVGASMLVIAGFFLILVPTGAVPLDFPRAVPFIDSLLTILLVGGTRFALRMTYVLNQRSQMASSNKNVLIVGAGLTGSIIVKELRSNPQSGLRPICFVDDNPSKQGVMIHGVRVMASLSDIPRLVQEQKIDEVIIAMPTAPGKIIRGVIQACKTAHVVSKTIPSVFEILSGSAVAQLRDVAIDDLLRRGVIEIDKSDVTKIISGGRVLVTGAGGSIGSELCRQIVSFRPKELVLLGHGENSIFEIASELRDRHGLISESVAIHTVIADIRDRSRMDHVFDTYKPEIIFHAAAHKHVGLMQRNVFDAVTNNVQGTEILVDLADKYDVKRLVMISSDKAVNPTSVMGVTKRIAELVVRNAAKRNGKNFVVVRFGNVLGSRGSVIPIFRQQILEGGPIKVTDPEVTRFFMTIPEAVQLVLQAGTMGKGGEIFVLDMGEPIKIVDLARDLLRLSGLEEGRDIDIQFTGLQKGEKMFEELFYKTEKADRSMHDKILVCRNGVQTKILSKGPYALMQSVHALIDAAHAGDMDLLLRCLVEIVPQYRDHEIAEIGVKKPVPKRGLILPIDQSSSEGPARPSSVGFSFKPM